MDKGDPDAMARKPRSRDEKILNKQSMIFIIAAGLIMCFATIFLFVNALQSGFVRASTVAFTSIIIMQMLFVLIARSEKHSFAHIGLLTNKKLILAIAVSIILQLMIIYVPFLNMIFKTEPLALSEWASIIAVSVAVFIVFEAVKIYKYRKPTTENNNK
jgi:Ca2+-transporting ATPase